MNLVIVESPAKCKKIESFLGKDFRVVASMGHFRDLPPKGLGLRMDTMDADYVVTKPDVVQRLSGLAQSAEKIYLCTDPDREGEAISWHLRCVLPDDKTYLRATFQEITKKAVKKAIDNPGVLNEHMVDAQQARRILDRIVGYKLSPELWKAFTGRGSLSAGRVQSVATRLVVDREREIEAFVEEISYKLLAHLAHANTNFKAEFKGFWNGSKLKSQKFKDKEKVEALRTSLLSETFKVREVQHKKQKVNPQAPFTTSNMQAKAANVLKMSASRSMQVAQKLYEGGHITYHRTDSVAISDDAQKASRALITQWFGEAYCPARAPKYKKGGGAQEAHECIRPTHMETKEPAGLSRDEQNLYQLIWSQFISSQMSAGEDAVTVVKLLASEAQFEARGRTEVFDGFRLLNRTEVQEKSRKKKDEESMEKQKLPALSVGDEPELKQLETKEVKTRPPARYSEASLIKKLEKEGIGRPSTYASIVATILKRGYVTLESRKYHATELGKDVTDFLVQRFPRVLELNFTKVCEERLDQIGEGEVEYRQFLLKFWAYLRTQLCQVPSAAVQPAPRATAQQKTPKPKPTSQQKPSSEKSTAQQKTPKPKPTSQQNPSSEKSTAQQKTPKPKAVEASASSTVSSVVLPKEASLSKTQELSSVNPSSDLAPVACPSCGKDTSFEPSQKWQGRYFYCCHACKAYLEAGEKGEDLGRDWLKK